ncbi:MAG: hypothetical protein N2314_05875 [Brevinematales bacterium]|nr:hypothetical protein [Brevinematales bacterium]
MEKKNNTTKILVASGILVLLVLVGIWVTRVVVENSVDTYATRVIAYYRALVNSSTNLTMVAPGFVDSTRVQVNKGYEIYLMGSREIAESNQMVIEYALLNKEGKTKVLYLNEALFVKSMDPKIQQIGLVKKGKLIEK